MIGYLCFSFNIISMFFNTIESISRISGSRVLQIYAMLFKKFKVTLISRKTQDTKNVRLFLSIEYIVFHEQFRVVSFKMGK